jgi:hypothetical protein
MKKGVKLVDLLGMVRKLQSTEGCPFPSSGFEPSVHVLTLLGENARL